MGVVQARKPGEDDRIATLSRQGRKVAEIAAELGRSEGFICERRRALGCGGRVQRRPDEDARIAELSRQGREVSEIAAELGRSEGFVVRRRRALGCGRADLVRDLEPLPGETWKDRRDLGLRVSSRGRVASLATNRIKTATRTGEEIDRGSLGYISVQAGGQKSTKRLETLLFETFGRTPSGREYRPAEPVIRGSVPRADALWSEARKAVSYGLPHDVQDDLISDIVLMRLEGFKGSISEALKVASKSHNALRGAFKERSLEDTIGGHSDLRIMDTIASDHDHF